jgi:hypothetical protein
MLRSDRPPVEAGSVVVCPRALFKALRLCFQLPRLLANQIIDPSKVARSGRAQFVEEPHIFLTRDHIRAARVRGEETGLNDDEIACYDALAENESAREVMAAIPEPRLASPPVLFPKPKDQLASTTWQRISALLAR